MLGQPISMLIPEVVGFKLTGKLREGATATDLVLTVTQMLRKKGVVGKFVEFYGPGLDELPLADRATIANMAPEYGATCGFFPIDAETIRYLTLTGRAPGAGRAGRGLCQGAGAVARRRRRPIRSSPTRSNSTSARSSRRSPGRKRPQDRVPLSARRRRRSTTALPAASAGGDPAHARSPVAGARLRPRPRRRGDRRDHQLHQHLEPERHARRRPARPEGRRARAEGEALGQDLAGAGLAGGHRLSRQGRAAGVPRQARLQPGRLWLHHLHRQFRPAARADRAKRSTRATWSVCAVLSGNRNFEGRVHPQVRANYLASPPLVVAYALAGSHARST